MLPIDLARYRYSLQNPFPPADRRYRLAKAYVAQGSAPSARCNDEYTLGAYKYLRARAQFRESNQYVAKVLRKYPDLVCAVKMHHGEAAAFRPIVEAYLLSGEKLAAIAHAIRVNPETIEWYEKMFYDVRGFSKASDVCFPPAHRHDWQARA